MSDRRERAHVPHVNTAGSMTPSQNAVPRLPRCVTCHTDQLWHNAEGDRETEKQNVEIMRDCFGGWLPQGLPDLSAALGTKAQLDYDEKSTRGEDVETNNMDKTYKTLWKRGAQFTGQ